MGKHEVAALRRAVFLDRDGVINRVLLRDGRPYPPATLEDFHLVDDAAETCRRLKAAGFLLVIATNQPDVGRGTQRRELVEQMHAQILRELPIDRIEVCYDAGDAPSEFRKPAPGMLRSAAHELGIDLTRSFMIGDRWRDIDCGYAAGCTTILIDYDYRESLRQLPDYRVKTLSEAANVILAAAR
jgi:D-glycero-D-manno-heptose 1,7-bisphosphate phosphatase